MTHLMAIVADLYTPFLILMWLFYLYQGNATMRYLEVKTLFFSLLLVYTLMFLDNYLHIWPIFSLDYSTHSAMAVIFALNLVWRNKILLVLLPLSLFAYFYLMWALNYHSFTDIFTTLLAVLPALIYWQYKLLKNDAQSNKT